jgi:chromosomal replication initiation ATPase DnaA
MTRATFDTWLRGSRVVAAEEGRLTVAVRYTYAVDWLENRLMPVIERTVARRTDQETQVKFVVG